MVSTYDVAGRLVLSDWDDDGDGQPKSWTETVHDEYGRLLSESTYHSGSNNPTIRFRAYRLCE